MSNNVKGRGERKKNTENRMFSSFGLLKEET